MTLEAAWGEFSIHTDDCVPCGEARARIVRMMASNPDWDRDLLMRQLRHCCQEGGDLALEWDRLCQVALGRQDRQDGDPEMEQISGILGRYVVSLQERRRRAGLTGLPEAEAQERISALMDMSDAGFASLMAVEPDERREASIQAVERSYWAGRDRGSVTLAVNGENGLTREQEDAWMEHYASHRCPGWYKCSAWQVTNPPARGDEEKRPTLSEQDVCPDCGKRVKPGGMGLHRHKAHGYRAGDA